MRDHPREQEHSLDVRSRLGIGRIRRTSFNALSGICNFVPEYIIHRAHLQDLVRVTNILDIRSSPGVYLATDPLVLQRHATHLQLCACLLIQQPDDAPIYWLNQLSRKFFGVPLTTQDGMNGVGFFGARDEEEYVCC